MAGDDAASRFRVALDLADLGVAMMRQSLRRRQPEASEAEIDAAMREWLTSRPMDAPGSPRAIDLA